MLEVYKDQFGVAAGFFTIIQLLSPAFLCLEVLKKKTTKGVDVMPLIGGLVLSVLFIQNSLLIEDKIMLYVNYFAFVLGIFYLLLYYLYTKEKVKFWITIGKAFLFITIIISYAQCENLSVVKFRFGLIVTLILFALISAPLLNVSKIIRTENADSLPIPLIVSGSAVAFSWLLYGTAINDSFTVIQNLVAFVIQISQLGLFLYIKFLKFSKRNMMKLKKKN